MKTRSSVVSLAQSWVGKKESDGSFEFIIDLYNTFLPHPRGYKLQYSDAWCAGTTSALAIKLGYTDIIPVECSCYYLIEKAKEMGIWVESDSYVPSPADFILYDWNDDGSGDNKGTPDHIGVVEKVSGNTITVIEGNYSNAVKRRTLKVNGKYIRGYITPKYDAEPETKPSTTTATKSVKATDSAKSFLKSLAGTYKVTASALNVRHGAGTSKKIMVTIPKGTQVKCYGYYTTVSGTKWLYVQFTYKGVKYTGFCSSKYLSKV